MDSKKQVSLSLENNVELDPKRTKLPIYLLEDRVLVKHIKPDTKVEGTDLLKPISAKEDYSKGMVYSIGTGAPGREINEHIKIDTIVNYWHQASVEFTIDKEIYHLVRASDIFAIL